MDPNELRADHVHAPVVQARDIHDGVHVHHYAEDPGPLGRATRELAAAASVNREFT